MSLDEAMQYMADHTVIPQEQIRTEIHRYITWPGQACAYKIGELEILRMRRKAEKMLGMFIGLLVHKDSEFSIPHDMETLPRLLAVCEGVHWAPVN